MNGKVCIVTGGNTGIGKETARGLAQRGAKVVLACRDTGRGEAARDDIARSTGHKDVEVIPLDLGSKASIRAFGERFRAAHERLDVLVNNAGVWRSSRGTTEDGLEATFGVNHVGTWLLTQDLLPLLKKSAPSRVVVLSSKLHYRGRMDWEDLQFERRKYGTTAAYAQSKLANVLFTKALARRLEGTGVTVNAVHPGVVRTDLMRDYPKLLMKLFNLFLLTPEQGAECSLHVATAPELAGVTGEYFEKSRIKPAAEAALDEAAQERLWKLTEALAV
ncbi:SDR family oxidoreductase [Sorangium sp. So ce302]|uniref:SDR family oxidoreductase n=1 Tax=Sorangium sp. So ce302 TaxID=3133297 RepID=UPI003F60A3A9